MKQFEEYYDYLVDYSVATEDEIRLVCSINGHNVESLESILYAKVGYRDFYQWLDLSCLNEQ